MIEQIITQLLGNGPFGIVLAVLIYLLQQERRENAVNTSKLFSVIENNTKAVSELTEAQRQRRKEFNENSGN